MNEVESWNGDREDLQFWIDKGNFSASEFVMALKIALRKFIYKYLWISM